MATLVHPDSGGPAERIRIRLRIEGVVRGVGFRPHVFRIAQTHHLAGFVGNDVEGVFLEVEGPADEVDEFQRELIANPPPAAVIYDVTCEVLRPQGDEEFTIVGSAVSEQTSVFVSPDLNCCEDCLAEINNPGDRRYLYPFTNCRNCGPRFSIIRTLPHERLQSSMAKFSMCDECRKEYLDPESRRFQAQSNACPACGPRTNSPVQEVVQALAAGLIVAIKGVGGYHLACDAYRGDLILRLRQAKGRFSKPFAIMVANLETAQGLAHLDKNEIALLTNRSRPIVILRSRGLLSEEVAPDLWTVGLMLPSTPLHHLLFQGDHASQALVMTSANPSGLPIIKDAFEAESQLGASCDLFLHHDRPIEVACDDSVVRSFNNRTLPIRRSRGFAPFPVKLPFDVPQSLAVGAQMKATFCLGRGREAFMSQHLGDLENLETMESFERALKHLVKLYDLKPEYYCVDADPGFLSTQWAERQEQPIIKVQHHHAHIAACMAENGLPQDARVLGIALDEAGYGSGGSSWGGEILDVGYASFKRRAWLTSVPLPGGDIAVREPRRMALAHLWAAEIPWDSDLPCVKATPPGILLLLERQLEREVQTVPTSSMGRLFDAVASLIGLRQAVDYEAQASLILEAVATVEEQGEYEFGEPLDPAPVLRAVITDLRTGVDRGRISMRFHRGLARQLLNLALIHGQGMSVALSGGVFQNTLLLELLTQNLKKHSITVLNHRVVPPNDGGIALGQLVIGACRYHNEGLPG